jgi:hypothetical protein
MGISGLIIPAAARDMSDGHLSVGTVDAPPSVLYAKCIHGREELNRKADRGRAPRRG